MFNALCLLTILPLFRRTALMCSRIEYACRDSASILATIAQNKSLELLNKILVDSERCPQILSNCIYIFPSSINSFGKKKKSTTYIIYV